MALPESPARDRAPVAAPTLGLPIKILFGLGEIAGSIRLVAFGLFLFFFYTTVVGLPGTLVGIASAVGLAWSAVVDPLIGHVSDRARLVLGRRHGFMLAGAGTMGLCFWALFSPPRGLPMPFVFGWLLATSLVFRLAGAVFGIPYRALGAELSQDYHERNSISGIRGACGLVGLLLASSLAFVLFFPNLTPGVDPKLRFDGYPLMGLVFGAVMSVTGLIPTLATLRLRPHLPNDVSATQPSLRFRSGLALALGSGSFRTLVVASSLFSLSLVVNGLLFVHFLTYYVRIADSRALSLLQFVFYGSAIVGVPIWLRVARRAEKRRLLFVAMLAVAALMVGARFLVGPGRPFGTGDIRPLLAGETLAGLFASLFWIVPASMIADVADEDELATGQRREGTLFGISSLGEQVASGLAVLATGVAIDRFAGLVPGQAAQSGLTVERIGLLYGLVPAGILLLAAFAILRYPLDRRRVRAIQAQLAAAGTRRFRPAGAVDAAPSGDLADSRREMNPAR